MGKIGLIISREYLTRVKKKSFLLLTLLGPLVWAALIIVPGFLTEAADNVKDIYVVTDGNEYYNVFHNSAKARFHTEMRDVSIDRVRELFKDSENSYVLYITKNIIDAKKVNIYSRKQPPVNLLSYISLTLSSELQKDLLKKNNIDKALVDKYITPIQVTHIGNNNKLTDTSKIFGMSMTLGMAIYLFVFLYSAQVMRGVIEEKSNRIIEVIISSVKPFQLMMGKILGIALVGLTQFLLWIILSIAIITPISKSILEEKHYTEISKPNEMQIGIPTSAKMNTDSGETKASEIVDFIKTQDWGMMIGSFAFYFLVGYLMYAALFAAVGSAVDSETDTQQFMLPVSAPLILAISMSGTVLQNPDGNVAFWLSIIPFTSPITMMMRIPFHPPVWEITLSMTLLIGFFVLMTWLAGRIYRTGILMYGKKTSWKEIGKWLFYKG
jgi:ABC-2 type transport system permease protein